MRNSHRRRRRFLPRMPDLSMTQPSCLAHLDLNPDWLACERRAGVPVPTALLATAPGPAGSAPNIRFPLLDDPIDSARRIATISAMPRFPPDEQGRYSVTIGRCKL